MRSGFQRLFITLTIFLTSTCGSIFTLEAEDFDWRNVGGQSWVTPVKNQFGGTCWAFGSSATLESKYMLTRNDWTYKPDVSEQQLVWETSPDMGDSIDGGSGDKVLTYTRDHGVVLDSECPHQSSSPDVGIAPYWPLANGWENRVFKSTSIKLNLAGFPVSVQTVKDALKKYGCVNLRFEVGADWYSPTPDSGLGGHIVSITGFHDDPNVPGGGYWIIKNSWGSTWNGDGYGKVAYATRPRYSSDIDAIDGSVYYTGSMVDATWKGGSGTWTNSGTNWNKTAVNGSPVTPATYAWENKESTATFNASTGTAITVSGVVIAHGLVISTGATGYTFSPPSTSSGAMTVTAGGITANESVTINVPVTVGAPQTWNVAAGKTLNITSAVHTIISTLTVDGSGNTEIHGVLDGGGVINSTGAAPGNLVKSGTGSLLLGGASNYSGTITHSGGTINFALDPGDSATYSGKISGSGSIVKSGDGMVILPYNGNTYSGTTTISGGALQANHGAGLSSSSFLVLDSGVLQSNSTVTFTRSLGTSGSTSFQWTASGGGFSAGSGAMTVKVNNGTSTLNWGSGVGSGIMGTLKFGSTTAANVVTFQNGINFNGADRTINVEDNSATTADYAVISGNLTNSTGTAGLLKTGPGRLVLTGGNSYNGTTTVAAGALDFSSATSVPSGSYVVNGGSLYFGGKSPTVAGLSITEGLLDGTGTLTSTSDYALQSGTVNMSLAGAAQKLTKTGTTTMILSKNNMYGGITTISDGVLQADDGVGLPSASFLDLNGGILQSNSTVIFSRPLGLSGSAFQWSAGGGFSAGAGAMTVKIGGGTETVAWGETSADAGSKIVGVLKLSSPTAAYATDFQNGLNLSGANRTIQVDDNSNAAGDYAKISGDIINTGNSAGIVKTGAGTLLLTGTNTYTGDTVISGGALQADLGTGIANSSFLSLDGGVLQSGSDVTFTRSLGTSGGAFQWTMAGGGFAAGGGSMTVQIGGGTDTVSWGDAAGDMGSKILGTLKLNSLTATSVTDFQNGLDLWGGNRTIQADDNTTSFADYAIISGKIVNTGATAGITKTGDGRLLLTNTNSYSGATVISGGVLQANDGVGLPSASFLSFDGGVLQSNGPMTLVRGLGTSGSTLQWTTNGGGFAAGPGAMTVNLGGGSATVNWGDAAGANIAGTLKFNSETAANAVTFVNGIDLKGGARVIAVADNPTTTADYAVLTGLIRDTTGGATLTKTGPGLLRLGGSSANTYTGMTTVTGGTLQLMKTSGTAVPGNLTITDTDPAGTFVILAGSSQIATSATVTFDHQSSGNAHLQLMGYSQTLGGISCSTGTGVIENTQTETSSTGTSSLTINNSAACSFNGTLRDTLSGSGKLALVKTGSGTLTLAGPSSGSYTGGLNVQNGTLDYSGGALPTCSYALSGGTLKIGSLSQSIPSLTMTGGTIEGSGTLTSSSNYNLQGGTIYASLAGTGIALTKTGTTTANLFGANTYDGTTMISGGALQANSGAGLPSASFLVLNGGVLQSASATTFTRALGTSGSAFEWTPSGGGFAAGGGALTVKIGNDTSTLTWGTTIGSQIVGTLKLGSITACNVVTFQNGIDLNGGARTLQVDDNTGTVSDYAVLSGVISNSTGTGTLNKTGTGTLRFGGSSSNTYTGTTTLSAGTIVLAKTSGGVAIPGNFTLTNDGSGSYVKFNSSNQIAATSVLSFTPTSSYAYMELLGRSQTVGGISCSTGRGVIENTQTEDNITANSVLTVNNSANYSYNGYIRDRSSGDSTGTLALIKDGTGTLTLSGSYITYTGNTTISGGALQANQSAGLSAGSYLVLNGGVLQSNGAVTFTRSLSATAGGTNFQWTTNGGGFSAGSGAMTVRVNNGIGAIDWGTDAGSGIMGTLKFGSPTAANVVTFQNGINLNGADRTIQVDDNPSTATDYAVLSGIISNSAGMAGIQKTGSGILRLTASNSYNGPTSISAGTLKLYGAGSIGSSSIITVNSGAVFDVSSLTGGIGLGGTQSLKGNGSVLGAVVANAGSLIEPGESIGTLSITGNLTLSSSARLGFELDTPAIADKISMPSSTLVLNSQQFSDFYFDPYSGFGLGNYLLIDAGTIQGNLGNHCSGPIGSYWATLSISNNDLFLTVVPEPSAIGLLGMGVFGLLAWTWRRRRNVA